MRSDRSTSDRSWRPRTPATTTEPTRDSAPASAYWLENEHYDLVQDPYQLDNLAYQQSTDSTVPDPTLEPLLSQLRFCAGVEGRDPQPRTAYCQ